MGEDVDRLAGLRRDERFAALAVERASGAVAHALDVGGTQGAVDVTLTYPDGRRGALEVTSHAGDGVRQNYALLGQDGWAWPNPGKWWWSAEVGDPRDIPRLRKCYAELILLCEAEGLSKPHAVSWSWHGDREALRWLVRESSCRLWGHPEVPARDGTHERGVMITPSGSGGGVDTELDSLNAEVERLLAVPVISRHVDKVGRVEADERHLWVSLGPGSVADGLYMALMVEPTSMPPAGPEAPKPLTHLWITTGYGEHLLGWARESGWSVHHVFG